MSQSITRTALMTSKGNTTYNYELTMPIDGIIELMLKIYKDNGGDENEQNQAIPC